MKSPTLPDLLRRFRGKRRPREMLALLRDAGVSRSRMALWAWEAGKQEPPREVLHAYVRSLGLDSEQTRDLYEAAGLVVVVGAAALAAPSPA